MDWNDLSHKFALTVMAVVIMGVGAGTWWAGVVTGASMCLVFLVAALIQRHSHHRSHHGAQ